MPETTAPVAPAAPASSTNSSAPIGGDHLDMDALRELSIEEGERELRESEAKAPKEPKEEKKEPPAQLPKGDSEKESRKAPEAAKQAPKAEEDSEKEDSKEEEEELLEDEELPSKYLVAKSKDGDKSYKVPKDALFEVKVDGKIEKLTAQEMVNRAAGATDLAKKHTDFGRAKKQLDTQIAEFQQKAKTVNENAAMLVHIAQNGNPEDFVQYYANLTGEDPARVMDNLVERVLHYTEQFSGMTEREKQLYNENRRFKFNQGLEQRRQTQTAAEQARQRQNAEIKEALNSHGLTDKEFLEAAEDVRLKISSGELDGRGLTHLDVVEYAADLKRESDLKAAIYSVDASLGENQEFFDKVSKAVVKTEALHGKMSPAEVLELINGARDIEARAISERLSKKVERVNRTGKTNPENANSRKQVDDSFDTLTLADHQNRIWGGE